MALPLSRVAGNHGIGESGEQNGTHESVKGEGVVANDAVGTCRFLNRAGCFKLHMDENPKVQPVT